MHTRWFVLMAVILASSAARAQENDSELFSGPTKDVTYRVLWLIESDHGQRFGCFVLAEQILPNAVQLVLYFFILTFRFLCFQKHLEMGVHLFTMFFQCAIKRLRIRHTHCCGQSLFPDPG